MNLHFIVPRGMSGVVSNWVRVGWPSSVNNNIKYRANPLQWRFLSIFLYPIHISNISISSELLSSFISFANLAQFPYSSHFNRHHIHMQHHVLFLIFRKLTGFEVILPVQYRNSCVTRTELSGSITSILNQYLKASKPAAVRAISIEVL